MTCIDEMKIGDAKKLAQMFGASQADTGPWRVGEKYLVHTPTLYYTGRLTFVGQHELHLDDAAAIFDQGRFMDSLKDGTLDEVEPVPVGGVIIGRGAVVSAEVWTHNLPEEQK
ncbi:MAG: hypothetical protein AAGI54_08255 [Planctomycetota bacterium]